MLLFFDAAFKCDAAVSVVTALPDNGLRLAGHTRLIRFQGNELVGSSLSPYRGLQKPIFAIAALGTCMSRGGGGSLRGQARPFRDGISG